VLAGALRDHSRALLVGERTYGKGVVQSIFRWKDMDFRLKLTTSHYFTPNGHRIERGEDGGLKPDLTVKVDRTTTNQLRQRLRQIEPPGAYRQAARDLAEKLEIPLHEPFPPQEDAQLAAALEEARRILR
jgi:carboxyl-terminal processing protease